LALFNIFGKKDVRSDITKRSPFLVNTEWVPYKLYAKKKSSSTLFVRVKNLTNEVLLTSLVVELPNKLGFDEMNLAKQRELRVGELGPGEDREAKFNIYNSLDADRGEYTVTLTAIAHYRDYGHVMNAVKKRAPIEVV
jgi:uncharacterized membrane protein